MDTPEALLGLNRMRALDRGATTILGNVPPCPVLYNLSGEEITNFYDDTFPFVLNFGSCSWPSFMENLSKFLSIARDFPSVKFLFIYIEEAHPTDGWFLPMFSYQISQHKHMEERIAAAKMMTDQLGPLPSNTSVMVDNMNNQAMKQYGALPERLYILNAGKIVYKGGPGPQGYNLEEVEAWLKESIFDNKVIADESKGTPKSWWCILEPMRGGKAPSLGNFTPKTRLLVQYYSQNSSENPGENSCLGGNPWVWNANSRDFAHILQF